MTNQSKCPTCSKPATEKALTIFVCTDSTCGTVFTENVTGRRKKGVVPMETEIWCSAKDYVDRSKQKISGARSLVPKYRKDYV